MKTIRKLPLQEVLANIQCSIGNEFTWHIKDNKLVIESELQFDFSSQCFIHECEGCISCFIYDEEPLEEEPEETTETSIRCIHGIWQDTYCEICRRIT